jgi:CheY-like chemotaxis protein
VAQVLVVDDNAAFIRLMTRILNRAGHKVVTCASGLEALKKMGLQPDDESIEPPDLVVLDIMMPKSDGYLVAAACRDSPRTREIPIVVVSALKELSRLFTAKVQVDGFLTKPFSSEELIEKVAKALAKRKPQA